MLLYKHRSISNSRFLQYCHMKHLNILSGNSSDLLWCHKRFGSPPYMKLPLHRFRRIFLFWSTAWKWAICKRGLNIDMCATCDKEFSSDHVLFGNSVHLRSFWFNLVFFHRLKQVRVMRFGSIWFFFLVRFDFLFFFRTWTNLVYFLIFPFPESLVFCSQIP